MTKIQNRPSDHRIALILFAFIFIVIFVLYTVTLAPGVVGGDAGEHQLAVPLLGIPHTTGYPLYILAGKLWTLLVPIGSMAWRVNLFSALWGALAAGLTGIIVYHLSKAIFPAADWAGAVIAGITLALGLTLWQWSVIAGVRSLNVFFFALLTLQAVLFARYRHNDQPELARKLLYGLAFTVGLSLAHHRTTVFYLPSLVTWIWWHDRALLHRPRRLFSLAALTLLPLTLYLFIYVRGINSPPYTHEQISDFRSFWFLVGSGDSTGLFFAIDPVYLPARLSFIWRDILAQLSLPGVVLAAIGGTILGRRLPAHFLFQALLVLLLLLFTLDFEVVNLNEAPTWYLMPAYFVFALWLGIGVNGVVTVALRAVALLKSRGDSAPNSTEGSNGAISGPLPARFQSGAVVLFALLFIVSLGLPNWRIQAEAAVSPLDDWRQLLRGSQAHRFVESSLPHVEPNGIIWGDWEQYTPFKYYQLVLGRRSDVTVRNPLDRWPEKVAAARSVGQPIYFTRKPVDLIGTPHLSMAGPLIKLNQAPVFEPPSELTPLDANFENELELIGYRAAVLSQRASTGIQADPILQMSLYWRAPQATQWDYALSLRLVDAGGQELYKQDAGHPVLSSYPTSLWTPGEVVGDYYELPLPSDAGPLTLHILPYRAEAPGVWHNLTLSTTEPPQEGVFLGPFSPSAGL